MKSIISNTDINNKQNNVCFQMEKIKDRSHINFILNYSFRF